ncbi:LicD family protein [Arenimonas sp.]|uniref:LicD family protein n=1 Tax=Arenimonas sp. TaxID=1872635 RepID=UPI0039E71D5E
MDRTKDHGGRAKSTFADYVPCPTDDLFASLCAVHEILESLGIEYVLSGGTLLGAVRHGDLLANDTDWDIEIIDSDVEKILAARDLFARRALVLEYPVARPMTSFRDGTPSPHEIERRIIKVADEQQRFHGDFFIQTLFSDGILRRFNVEEGAYFNAKMSFPYWFVENRCKVRIRDREFFAPAEPAMMLERIYGPLWRTPYRRHGPRIKGYNFAGAYLDAPLEPGMRHALERGWIPRYPGRPRWPREIRFIDTHTTARWIARHEHLEDLPDEAPDAHDIDAANARLVACHRLALNRLKYRDEELREYESRLPVRWLNALISGARDALARVWRGLVNLRR